MTRASKDSEASKSIIEAYRRGYRVTDDGRLFKPDGSQVEIRLYGKQRYHSFTIYNTNSAISKRDTLNIKTHRFAAYCFYGEAIFERKTVVRHKNENVLDVSRDNLTLGTQKDNMLDVPKSVRQERYRKMMQGKEKHKKMDGVT